MTGGDRSCPDRPETAGNKGFGPACRQTPHPGPRTCAAGGRHRRAPRQGHRGASGTRLRRCRGPAVPLVLAVVTVGVAVAAPAQGEAGVAGRALELVRGAAGGGGCGNRSVRGGGGGPAGRAQGSNQGSPRAGRTRAPTNESEGRARRANGHRPPGRSPSLPVPAERGSTGSASSNSSTGSPGGSSRGPAMPRART